MPPTTVTENEERAASASGRASSRNRRNFSASEIPFGVTTEILIDSIVSAAEKGKIKIARIEDNTAQHVDILVHLPAGADPGADEESPVRLLRL